MKNEMYSFTFSHSFLSWSYCCSNCAWGSSDCDAKCVCVCVCVTDLLFDGEVIFAVSLEFSAFVWLEFA